jgi:hypothetical protein
LTAYTLLISRNAGYPPVEEWEQGSVQGCIIVSTPQRQGEKCVFEHFSFDNVNIHLLSKSPLFEVLEPNVI